MGRWNCVTDTAGVRLTSCGGDIDVDADLGDASSLERRHTGIRAKVGELEVYDVEVGGAGGDVRVGLGDHHTLRAPQGSTVLEPAERQLLRRGGLDLGCQQCYIDRALVNCEIYRSPLRGRT